MDVQENVLLRLMDTVFGAFAIVMKEYLPYMSEEAKAKWSLGAELVKRLKDILKCIICLFVSCFDGAIRFVESCGGG